ncbi:MAG: ABC transporter ATP-binding protein [Proteobacteria bacterium]|jgi:branched-chain amino acid transport system ATP-binding protein|nr:ABC transporter ATP-binding protein [Candidatus Fonsibacter lacus]
MNLLKINSVTKKFGGFTAVDNVSLKINRGDIRFIIGPNGAGKSTLFKMIIGVHNLNSGTILFNEKNIEKLPLNKRINLGIGVKFQAPSIFNELTVEENLNLAIKLKSNSGIKNFIERFGLENDQKKLAGDLSHGKKQWLDIALSSISKPQLIFLDEPTAGLSFEETKKTGQIIQDLNKQGMTFVIVEHDMEILKQIAKSVSVLHLGKLFFEGSPKEVLSNKQVTNIYLGIS